MDQFAKWKDQEKPEATNLPESRRKRVQMKTAWSFYYCLDLTVDGAWQWNVDDVIKRVS